MQAGCFRKCSNCSLFSPRLLRKISRKFAVKCRTLQHHTYMQIRCQVTVEQYMRKQLKKNQFSSKDHVTNLLLLPRHLHILSKKPNFTMQISAIGFPHFDCTVHTSMLQSVFLTSFLFTHTAAARRARAINLLLARDVHGRWRWRAEHEVQSMQTIAIPSVI